MFIPQDAHVKVHNFRLNDNEATAEGRNLVDDRPTRPPQLVDAIATPKKGPPTTGKLKTLVVRLTDGNNVPVTASASQLKNDVFDDGASLKTQTEACSYDKLKIEPFKGNTPSKKYISNGIVDVKMDYKMSSKEPGMDQKAIAAAKAELGDLDDDMFDLVLFCVPPGGDFVAFAYANTKYSFYNDKWCSFVSSQMHEVGHNLGLGHSGEIGGSEIELSYGDTAGIMGFSFEKDDSKLCYNPQKNYQLGWYENKVDTINPLDGIKTRAYTLNGVSDYKKNNDALVSLRLKQVSIKEKDYYIGYNRADGINKDTREHANMVTINRKEVGAADEYGQSTKIAALNPGERYVIEDFDNKKDVTIEFIGLLNGDARIMVLEGDKQADPPPGDCQKFTIEVTTDRYPEDTYWNIVDTGDIGYVGGISPVYTQDLTKKTTQVCLPMGKNPKTYKFTIYDREGDGLTYGNGSYKIKNKNGQTLVFRDDGEFSSRTHYLEVDKDPNPPPPTKAPTQAPTAKPTPTPPCENYTVEVKTDNYPQDTSWEFISFNEFNEATIIADKFDYEMGGVVYEDTVCLPEGRTYKFRIYDSYKDGLCCGSGKGYFRLIDKCGKVIVDSDEKELQDFDMKEFTVDVDNFCEANTAPTKAPTKAPTHSPSTDDGECKDLRKEKEKFRIKPDGSKNTCKFYAKKNKCDQIITTGKNENQPLWQVCPDTCNRCGDSPPTDQSSNDKCEDDKKKKEKFRIKEDGQKNTCKFYESKGKCDQTITTGKNENKKVWEICKSTCNKC